MGELIICTACKKAYGPKQIGDGTWELQKFEGWTVDFRAKILTKEYRRELCVLPFYKIEAEIILGAMHRKVRRQIRRKPKNEMVDYVLELLDGFKTEFYETERKVNKKHGDDLDPDLIELSKSLYILKCEIEDLKAINKNENQIM